MKVALYARNSQPPKDWKPKTPGEEPPGSWVQQLQELEAWAKREGHEVVLAAHDAQVSGKDPNRPGWKKVLAEVRGHHVQAVAAAKLDRVMRSAVHFHDTVRTFSDASCDLIFTTQGLSLSRNNPVTKAMMGFLALMAELERDLAVERTASMMRIGDDGRTYGPRSKRPAGRPVVYGEGHRFRVRDGKPRHDAARCPLCRRSQTGEGSQTSQKGGRSGVGHD